MGLSEEQDPGPSTQNLVRDMSEHIFIGVAWPYANGSLHVGHLAGVYVPADIFARYCRSRGYDTLSICATDEHGAPVAVLAVHDATRGPTSSPRSSVVRKRSEP